MLFKRATVDCSRMAGANEPIASLREQPSFFRDYVQTVPYMGYRFKA